LIVFPRTQLDEAEARVRGVAAGQAALVERVAAHVHPGGPAPVAPGPEALLDAARQLGREVTAAARVVSRSEEACRWNPAGQRGRATAERLGAAIPVLEMVERQVRGMARAVTEAGPGWSLPSRPSQALARLLHEVAAELEAWNPLGNPDQPDHPTPAAEGLGEAENGLYGAVLGSLRGSGLTPHAAALVTAIAVDARRIREELSWRPSPEIRARGWRSLFDEGTV